MLSLTKKQVKSLLEVISSDDTRPVLCHAKIDEYNGKPVLVATDGYMLVALNLDGETFDLKEVQGKLIPRAELVKWYKLADNKSAFTEADLYGMAVDESEVGVYPVWQKLIPDEKDFSAVASLSFNANYMVTMQLLADRNAGYNTTGMQWHFYGKLSPIVARLESGIYIVMPLKG